MYGFCRDEGLISSILILSIYIRVGLRVAQAQLLDAHCIAIELLLLLEADVRVLPRRRLDLLDLDLVDLHPCRPAGSAGAASRRSLHCDRASSAARSGCTGSAATKA